MFRKNWIFIIILLGLLSVLVMVARRGGRQQVNWIDDYTAGRKSPYACKLTHVYIDNLMKGELEDIRQTAYQQLSMKDFQHHNYIFINPDFESSAEDVHELFRFMRAGNTVFVAAHTFGAELSDSLHIDLSDPAYLDFRHSLKNDSTLQSALAAQGQVVEANFVNPAFHYRNNFKFDRTTYSLVFSKFDTLRTTVLGVDNGYYVNFIRVKVGAGQIYLHTLPEAYTNYYASSRFTAPYLFRALSYLPVQETFWDENYKAGKFVGISTDSRRFIMGEPALKKAYQIIIGIGFLVLLFGVKRRQRAVPVQEPMANSTLEFVETVGALYYRQGNHYDIISKKINYFLESIRSRFQTPTDVFDEEFVKRINRLSGVPEYEVQQLFLFIGMIRQNGSAQEQHLKKLEQQIWEFNQKSKR